MLNGNLRANLDYNIIAIKNNILNLPDTIQLKNGNQIINHYLADGRRYKNESKTYLVPLVVPLAVVVSSSDPYTTTTDVIHGDYYYKNGILHMVRTSEGYISYTRVGIDSHPEKSYFYYTHDHLGNVRIAQNFDGWIRSQSTEYYPTTLHYDRSTYPELQPFKYGGKELITMHGVDTYDFSARMLSPMLMRFMSIDPLCEKYYSISPYVYCMNNPVRIIDPTGEDGEDVILGYGIGLVTNVIPGTGFLRDMYTPTDPSDYNNALQGIDNATIALGGGMINTGGTGMAIGGIALTAGTVATVSTGGTAAIGGVPVAAAGATLIQAGATVTVGGTVLMANGKQNQEAGYNRGKNSGTQPKSINQLNKDVKKGKSPQGITRFDTPKDSKGGQDHVHFKNGAALNKNGE